MPWSKSTTNTKAEQTFEPAEIVVPLLILDGTRVDLTQHRITYHDDPASMNVSVLEHTWKSVRRRMRPEWCIETHYLYSSRSVHYKDLFSYVQGYAISKNGTYNDWPKTKKGLISAGLFSVYSLTPFKWTETDAKTICERYGKAYHEIHFRPFREFKDEGRLRIYRYVEQNIVSTERGKTTSNKENSLIWLRDD